MYAHVVALNLKNVHHEYNHENKQLVLTVTTDSPKEAFSPEMLSMIDGKYGAIGAERKLNELTAVLNRKIAEDFVASLIA